jgi:RNA recognition motif-containing protein
MNQIFVGNLPWSTTADDLRELFGQHGKVDSAQIIFDREKNRPRGFGFVTMSDGTDAAIEALNGQEFRGRRLVVNVATSQRPRVESRD